MPYNGIHQSLPHQQQCNYSISTPKKILNNHSRSPPPPSHHVNQHINGKERQHYDIRSQSLLCQTKFLSSPLRQKSDLGFTSRSRSPTVKTTFSSTADSFDKIELDKSRVRTSDGKSKNGSYNKTMKSIGCSRINHNHDNNIQVTEEIVFFL